jgi:hypothetical protein
MGFCEPTLARARVENLMTAAAEPSASVASKKAHPRKKKRFSVQTFGGHPPGTFRISY